MGDVLDVGARLKDARKAAGVRAGAVEVSFRGEDIAPLQASPHFEKPLTIDHALNEDVIIAYEMNGGPLPMLNGFPVRLIVPGWFATYWVKCLSQITVRTAPLHNFWVDTAYPVPTTPDYSQDPKHTRQPSNPVTKPPTLSLVAT